MITNDRTQVRRYIFNFENCSKKRSRCWRGERREVFNLIYYISIYYYIIYNIIIYKVDFTCASLQLDFTKCTCVPAFAPTLQKQAFGVVRQNLLDCLRDFAKNFRTISQIVSGHHWDC